MQHARVEYELVRAARLTCSEAGWVYYNISLQKGAKEQSALEREARAVIALGDMMLEMAVQP